MGVWKPTGTWLRHTTAIQMQRGMMNTTTHQHRTQPQHTHTIRSRPWWLFLSSFDSVSLYQRWWVQQWVSLSCVYCPMCISSLPRAVRVEASGRSSNVVRENEKKRSRRQHGERLCVVLSVCLSLFLFSLFVFAFVHTHNN